MVSDEASNKLKKIEVGKVEEVTEKMATYADACIMAETRLGGEELYDVLCRENGSLINEKVLEVLEDSENFSAREKKEQILEKLVQEPILMEEAVGGLRIPSSPRDFMEDYRDYVLIRLETLNCDLIERLTDYFKVLKYSDVGEPSLNVPMMWTPVLGYMENFTPYYREGKFIYSNEAYDRGTKVLYYGFCSGKLDALLKSYYARVQCLDDTGKYQKFYGKDKKSKIPQCTYGLFNNYERRKERVLILNTYPKIWRTNNGNKDMVSYVSKVLMGKNPVEDKFFKVEGLRMAIRMVMPLKQNLDEFEGCYPFLIADTCSPVDLEIIIIKLFDDELYGVNNHEKRLGSIKIMFPDGKLKKRIKLINDKIELIQYLRIMRIRRINEIMSRIDMVNEWYKPYFGSHNRCWYLASPQMPNLCSAEKMKELNELHTSLFRKGRRKFKEY